jgi:uncharacterized protein
MRIPMLIILIISVFGCNQFQTRSIYVSGNGEIEVVPDMAYLNVNASSTRIAAKESYRVTSEAINSLVDECKKLGIDKKDIKTSHISVDKQYQWIKNTQTFVGYYSSAYLKITVRNLDMLGKLTEKVLETKTNEINGISYNHSRYDSLYNEAGVIALQNAKNIAGKMAKEMKLNLGQVVRISNEKNMEPGGISYGAGYGSGFGGINALLERKAKSKVVQVEPGIIKISNTSYVTFEIR